nr:MAG TPA: hypothetical protein [Caudoviricetes sp.]
MRDTMFGVSISTITIFFNCLDVIIINCWCVA